MTQTELGAAPGWGDKGTNRLAQCETNYRVPRKDLVTEMAKIPKSNSSDDTAIHTTMIPIVGLLIRLSVCGLIKDRNSLHLALNFDLLKTHS